MDAARHRGASSGGPPPAGGGGGGGATVRCSTGWPGPGPPAGATPLDTTGVYDRLAGTGFAYGPLFQGLGRAWRLGERVFAEVALPEAGRGQAGAFGIHPALLDAALHAVVFAGLDPAESAAGCRSVSPTSRCTPPVRRRCGSA